MTQCSVRFVVQPIRMVGADFRALQRSLVHLQDNYVQNLLFYVAPMQACALHTLMCAHSFVLVFVVFLSCPVLGCGRPPLAGGRHYYYYYVQNQLQPRWPSKTKPIASSKQYAIASS